MKTCKQATALVVLAILIAGCGDSGTEASTTSNANVVVTGAESPTTSAAPSTTDAVTDPMALGGATTTAQGSSAGVIPADCAEGFTEYLVMIEPTVAEFDPSSAILGEFFRFDDAVGDQGIALLQANGSRATYSCSEVGLEFAYFDSRTPWDAVLEIAQAEAPGTVAYLSTMRDVSAMDVQQLSDHGVATCDEAVARIQQGVADQVAAGHETVAFMGVNEGLALLGLYNAYLAEVREERCPRDVLGNDEFGFMYERLPG